MNKLVNLLLGLSILAAHASHASLVAHYTFDNSGDLYANTGSVTTSWNSSSGVTQSAGLFGAGAGSFVAGTSSLWGNSFNIADLSSFSLSMHVKSTQTNSWDDFISFGSGVSGNFVLERNGSEGVSVFNIGGVGGTATSEGAIGYAPGSATFDVDDGSWHHLGMTVGNGTLSLYVDGVNRGTAAYSGSGNIAAIQIASRLGDPGRAITTEIDDIAIYNVTLSSAQMLHLSSNVATANPIPEPSSAAILTAMMSLLLVGRRR